MKRTKITGKLRLDRETLAPLQSSELDAIHGGVVYTGCVSQCTKCPTQTNNPITRTTATDRPTQTGPFTGGPLTGNGNLTDLIKR